MDFKHLSTMRRQCVGALDALTNPFRSALTADDAGNCSEFVMDYIEELEAIIADATDLEAARDAMQEAKEKGTITLEQLEEECDLKPKKKQSN